MKMNWTQAAHLTVNAHNTDPLTDSECEHEKKRDKNKIDTARPSILAIVYDQRIDSFHIEIRYAICARDIIY